MTFQCAYNLLLLGTGESGKSTFVKQMKILHGQEFTAEELKSYTRDLLNNVIDTIVALVKGMDELQIPYEV